VSLEAFHDRLTDASTVLSQKDLRLSVSYTARGIFRLYSDPHRYARVVLNRSEERAAEVLAVWAWLREEFSQFRIARAVHS